MRPEEEAAVEEANEAAAVLAAARARKQDRLAKVAQVLNLKSPSILRSKPPPPAPL